MSNTTEKLAELSGSDKLFDIGPRLNPAWSLSVFLKTRSAISKSSRPSYDGSADVGSPVTKTKKISPSKISSSKPVIVTRLFSGIFQLSSSINIVSVDRPTSSVSP